MKKYKVISIIDKETKKEILNDLDVFFVFSNRVLAYWKGYGFLCTFSAERGFEVTIEEC